MNRTKMIYQNRKWSLKVAQTLYKGQTSMVFVERLLCIIIKKRKRDFRKVIEIKWTH